MKKTPTENIALHILEYTIFYMHSSWYSQISAFGVFFFLILTKCYVSTPLSITHQNATTFCHLILSVFVNILCSDLVGKNWYG